MKYAVRVVICDQGYIIEDDDESIAVSNNNELNRELRKIWEVANKEL